MKCELLFDQIPIFIRKEIPGEERIQLIEHLKTCQECRDEYLKNLKMYYTIESRLVKPEPELDNIQIKLSELETNPKRSFSYIWAIAASLLIIVASMIVFTDNFIKQNERKVQKAFDINQKIINEDWAELSDFIQNQPAIEKNFNQIVSMNLLVEKLKVLERSGIEQFTIANEPGDIVIKEVQINILINKLEKYKKYRSEISVKEISDYLSLI